MVAYVLKQDVSMWYQVHVKMKETVSPARAGLF